MFLLKELFEFSTAFPLRLGWSINRNLLRMHCRILDRCRHLFRMGDPQHCGYNPQRLFPAPKEENANGATICYSPLPPTP